MKNTISLFVLILFSCFAMSAQEIEIKGKITTYGQIPVVNADVIIQSSSQAVKTDEKGEFTCTSQTKDKLTFIANGFIKQTYKIRKKHDGIVNVDLKLSSKAGSEEKAIKAAHILELDKFRELVKLGPNYKDYSKYSTLIEALKNEFPSLKITPNEIIIRGPNSISLSSSAGIEVDGILVGLGMLRSLNPDNIASIEVIKGSQTARYGTRGANGMVVIKTKN
jgi:Skp family chaperone for outer membrane proteins